MFCSSEKHYFGHVTREDSDNVAQLKSHFVVISLRKLKCQANDEQYALI
ncbi:3040_t:CDS:2 [Paraglomus occultum]|uniref:3040_t:CDS:1 n=1 Tax=Paraglomus occultum TaxID=144539 RepID=A0A9N8ZHK3_9GLOM|nr:3040_t:CDS:2 [Paraglomus occultum]